MTDWMEPKTLISQDRQRALVDYITKNDLLHLYENMGIDILSIRVANADPSDPAEGDIYLNSVDKSLRIATE